VRAVWYERQGPAVDVLEMGTLADPEPGPGEVRVRVTFSGVNPGDAKKRRGWQGSSMPYPRVIPHSDGAGLIDRIGEGVDEGRVGSRVWVYRAQSYRPFGTAAQYTVVPERLAVNLPDDVSDEVGACLGIPGITAHGAVFGDGPVAGSTVLVHGVLGGVGSMAASLARWGGARVIGTVRRPEDVAAAERLGLAAVIPLSAHAADGVRDVAPEGVDRIVEVAFSDNVDLDATVVKVGGTIAAFATRHERPSFPFWPMLFDNVTIRLLGSDDFPVSAAERAAADLTDAARTGALVITLDRVLALEQTAVAHDRVEAGTRGRVLVAVDE
jgi:NADPH2:quinone reductase